MRLTADVLIHRVNRSLPIQEQDSTMKLTVIHSLVVVAFVASTSTALLVQGSVQVYAAA